MDHVEIRKANKHDALYIGERVREDDFNELVVQTHEHPYYTMVKGIDANPDKAMTGLLDGVPVCMWGVTPAGMILRVGIPWMVGTYHLDDAAFTFLKRNRGTIIDMLNDFDILVNYVDARNVRAIGWLKFCGFTIDDPEPYGNTGLLFHKFWMTKGE